MDLIKVLTYIVQHLHNTYQPYFEGYVESPGENACRLNYNAGYLKGLKDCEYYIREMAMQMEEDGYIPPKRMYNIEPLGNRYSESNKMIRRENQ